CKGRRVDPRMLRDTTADDHLNLLLDLENYLGKALAPYEEFSLGGKTYYLSPGGFLHRKDPGTEEERGSFCG
ncbi:MAG: hypothetical protein LC751_10825, partial [Actinobacteria bacterium]|nr:hypothetical protein [Actinomycetota bacterium]